MTDMTVHKINFFRDHINITFNTHWYQEDMINLRDLIFARIPNHEIKELVQGADRENLRFLWQDNEYILNLEYYSQSCWISAHDEKGISSITALLLTLNFNEKITSK
jgi:hypothetical protein